MSERLEGDAFLGQLPLDVFMAVDAQLGVVREVGAELEKERTEVFIDAVEVELVDRRRTLDDPGILLALVASVRFSVRKTVTFSWALPRNRTPSFP